MTAPVTTSGTSIHIYNSPPITTERATEITATTDDSTRRRMLARLSRGHALSDGAARGTREPIRAQVPPAKGDSQTATIRLYDPIDSWGEWYGVSAKEFASVLDELPDTVTEIRLLINSPGGECTEGFAILNLLRNHPARTVAVVEGLAASAASYVAAACDELIVSPNAEVMVHNPHGICMGEAADMRQLADLLDHLADNMASIYAAKAGGTAEQWRAVMDAETWFSAQEAVDAGLADSVLDQAPADPKATARFDLSVFNFAGRAHAPEPKIPADHPAVGSSATTEGGPAVAFSDEQYTDLREKLGVEADADGDSILAAVDSLLEQATAPPTQDPALPDGVVAISEAQLDELRNDAQAGREARAQQITAERSALVEAAVKDGRIAPAERDAWLAKLETGTGAEQVLAALKPGVIPVDQLGHGGNADLDSDEAIWSELFGKEVKA